MQFTESLAHRFLKSILARPTWIGNSSKRLSEPIVSRGFVNGFLASVVNSEVPFSSGVRRKEEGRGTGNSSWGGAIPSGVPELVRRRVSKMAPKGYQNRLR